MGRMKELFMEQQEALAAAYLDEHPGATDEEAWEYVNGDDGCDRAMNNLTDNLADMADRARDAERDSR